MRSLLFVLCAGIGCAVPTQPAKYADNFPDTAHVGIERKIKAKKQPSVLTNQEKEYLSSAPMDDMMPDSGPVKSWSSSNGGLCLSVECQCMAFPQSCQTPTVVVTRGAIVVLP